MRIDRNLQLKRKLAVARRQALWTYEDAPPRIKPQALKLYRRISVLYRQVGWLMDNRMLTLLSDTLKRVYAPAITDLFKRQIETYQWFVENGLGK